MVVPAWRASALARYPHGQRWISAADECFSTCNGLLNEPRRFMQLADLRLLLCRFSDAGNRGSIHTRGRPASEKRQGRKSRSVVQRRCGVRYGDLAAGLELMRLDRSRCGGWFAVNRGWLHRGEGAIGTLHDGICGANTGQCRGRMRACLRPAASQRGWQVSELLSIGGDGITRCRS